MEQLLRISEFILDSFIHIWPYLLITIPLSVIINLTNTSKYISKVFEANPVLAVFLATVIGAFSPFCSCGVIPVITSLLIGGVPLAPVMSFWIASPSMDPEIFFLSSSQIGLELATWRLAATFVISLISGYFTLFLSKKGFIPKDVMRLRSVTEVTIIPNFFQRLSELFNFRNSSKAELKLCCMQTKEISCCEINNNEPVSPQIKSAYNVLNKCGCSDNESNKNKPDVQTIMKEIVSAVLMVSKFMGIAFLITALMTFYFPDNLANRIVSLNPTLQVFIATIMGVPMYTSNLTALPVVAGLLEIGFNKGAALSFLIGGATTTLPALMAVWGITKTRVFLLYLSYVFTGALITGIAYNLMK